MSAPYFAALADGPPDGRAAWLVASDARRIRAGVWGVQATKGTVFLLPGRTEYVEKYGRAATDLLARGYATLSVDWRGQGLADRIMADPLPGHVSRFAEFQLDFQALVTFARAQGLPEPYYLLAHSMGGCIGLRALMTPHPFRAAAFSAPMWGILIPAWQRPFAATLARMATRMGLAQAYAPGTGPATYVTTAPFADNTLTTDPVMWAYMRDHLLAEPRLALGGPTMAWLNAALTECAALAALPSPALPAFVALGTHERIVDPDPIRARMARWKDGTLQSFAGCEHEIMMEGQRGRFFDLATALFDANR
jgi:lysophospholipase